MTVAWRQVARLIGSQSLVGRAANVAVARAFGAALGLAATVLIGRLYGPSVAGSYFLAVSIVSVGSILARLGMPMPIMRMVSVAFREGDRLVASAIRRKGLLLAAAVGAVLTVALLVFAQALGTAVFGDALLPRMLRLTALGLVPMSLVFLQARALMAIGKATWAEYSQRAGYQAAFIVLLLATRPAFGPLSLGLAFFGAYLLALVTQSVTWRAGVGAGARGRLPAVPAGSLLRPGLPLLLASSVTIIMNRTDTIMLGALGTPDDVGVYGAAMRAAAALALLLPAASSVVGPRYAQLHAAGKTAELARLVQRVTIGTTLGGLALFLVYVFGGRAVMGLFGSEFTRGTASLVILAAGQFVNTATGLVGVLLAMAGRERRVFHATTLGALTNVVLNLALIPPMGIAGAATASAISVALVNLLNVYFTRRDLGINMWPPLFRRGGA